MTAAESARAAVGSGVAKQAGAAAASGALKEGCYAGMALRERNVNAYEQKIRAGSQANVKASGYSAGEGTVSATLPGVGKKCAGAAGRRV